ncbi:meiosis regulator and mRNA stability factor 1-like [Dendronephthya gigantea]|uniref:meiosis regulator and mRNA stability factor 1-like n=1 Tax=Dendronephthya gigantea TaxID=151771 RepID=UPI00106C8C94|nr:meiosis regulator and mRNA stability factor 1-like [Dendronephthya gigantea]
MEDKFSVWIGSLSLQCKEQTLSDYFGKFGPVKSVVICRDELGKSKQFGYVNFYNREIAECAATVMDGCELLGQTIKTKGPSELQKLRNEQNIASKKDYRMFTDCLFFIDGRQCTWRYGECLFRHCGPARNTEVVCVKWLERRCENIQCPKRHPRLTKTPTIIDNTVTRCPSHNAFKCFGECGNEDCNTHFLDNAAYHEHVKTSMKKLAHPVDTCTKCQAVFFKEEERINHRCYKNVAKSPRPGPIQQFTSTRLQAEKDIVHPHPTYPVKTCCTTTQNNTQNIHTQQTNMKNKKYQTSCDCLNNNYDKTQMIISKTNMGNSIKYSNKPWPQHDSNNCNGLSTSLLKQESFLKQGDPTIQHCARKESNPNIFNPLNTPSANHMQKPLPLSSINAINSSPNHLKTLKELEPVGVFWDFENCSVPKGKSAQAVVQKIRRVFFKEKREVEFMCVCDTSKEKKTVIEELNKAQVTVVHINATSKNAADDKLRQSLRRFAQTFSRPATVILISGDGNFAADLSDLRHRHNFQIICLHYVAASSALLAFAHETHRFDQFTEELQALGQTTYKSSFSNDVLVTNLPITKNTTVLKTRLTKLSDNCGGKVVSINGNKAIVRFPNSEAAYRARRRLDKEDLFGNILRATQLPLTNNKDGGDESPTRQKHDENSSDVSTPTSSYLVKPRMGLRLNENTSNGSWKENQSLNCSNGTKNIFNPPNQTLNFPQHRFKEPSQTSFPYPNPQIFPRHPGPMMFNSLHHSPLLHNIFGLRGGGSPSPIPIATPPSPLSSPPSPLRPVVNGMAGRSPSPEQQFNGVDLLVTNINEGVPKNEIQKKIASVFREHCKVYSVVLYSKNGAPLRAFVKVPKPTDAHIAITKVSGKSILGKIVHVSLATERDKESCYLQDEAISILRGAPLSWLPLATFFTNFEKKYRKRLDERHLDQIQDIVVVNGSLGCQTISLLEGKIDSETVIVDDSFSSDVVKLLHHYDGVIPLVSFPALYWLEFHKDIAVSSTGSALEELLCRIPNVTVTGSTTKRNISWQDGPPSSPGDTLGMSQLGSRLVDILQQDHEFDMTFERLQEKYLSCYGCELDPMSYGFQNLSNLLRCLVSIAQVKEVSSISHICLLHQHRVKLFKREISELLKKQPQHSILLSNFMASYVKHFGQKFKLSSFGFTRLTDLIKAVSSVAEIEGVGDQRTVKLVLEGDEKLSNSKDFNQILRNVVHSVVQVKADIFTLVNAQETKLICLKNISKLYENYFHHTFPYDSLLLNEAIENLDKPLEVRGKGNEQIIGILHGTQEEKPKNIDFPFVRTAVEILYECLGYTLEKKKFLNLYQEKLRRNGTVPQNDASLPSCVQVTRVDGVEMVELKPSYCARVLVEELKQLFSSIDDSSIFLDELPERYEEYFKKIFHLELHGSSCLEDFRERLNGFITVTSSANNAHHITLSPISRFEVETQALLDKCGGCLSLSRFAPVYQQMYSKPCIVSDYGYTKLSSLLNAVPHVARIIGTGPEKVVIAVQRSISERVTSDMLSVQIIGGSTEEICPVKKDKPVQPPSSLRMQSLSERAPDHEAVSSESGTAKVCSPVGEKGCFRATPSKVRLAANFTLQRNEK